ncbi:MAG: 8-amino-7-oxononanoate synthase [Gammaproteobacteria bacterium]|nr:8-amino-7-oxononanoate synthase [Gammaproteobacteria bacterium]
MQTLQPELERRRRNRLYRRRRVSDGPQGPELRVDGRKLLSFCSNDYLGLAADPLVVAALTEGAGIYGVGSGAAHLVNGHSQAHHGLEEELADFTRRPRALLFSTGYMANLGVVSALLGRGDTFYGDRLNHASLIDGGLLSRARFQRYPHGDAAFLEKRLEDGTPGRTLIATDGVFSMDGDIAPLPALAAVCRGKQDAWLMVDDAHGLGVLGSEGRGSVDHLGLEVGDIPVLMGTLGKALGTFGAFVAGSEELIETLIQEARSYVFTTALPPAVAHATRTSLALARGDEWRREKLKTLIARFRRGATELGLPLMASETPIQPILTGTEEKALAWSEALEAEGLMVTAIRPPTVPANGSRLRITLSAAHTEEQVSYLLGALEKLQGANPL